MQAIIRVLVAIFPPTHKHPSRAAHEWPVWDDPYRPLEPGEDWAGNLREIAFAADYNNTGRKVFKNVLVAAR